MPSRRLNPTSVLTRDVMVYEYTNNWYGPLEFGVDRELYLIQPDGTGKRYIPTFGGGGLIYRYDPALSPGAWRIAFASNPLPQPVDNEYEFEIGTVDLDGGHATLLTTGGGRKRQPTWSPDGSKIAFAQTKSKSDRLAGIYIINADGSGLRRLANTSIHSYQPAWSPDGKSIAYIENATIGGSGFYLKTVDDDEPSVPIGGGGRGTKLAWSPDGTRIAFTHLTDEIWVMKLDDKVVRASPKYRQLTFQNYYLYQYDRNPVWSPDGKKIAFERQKYAGAESFRGTASILMMDSTLGERTPLPKIVGDSSSYCGAPSWGTVSSNSPSPVFEG